MIIHDENNKKTENIKRFLAVFSNQLFKQRKITIDLLPHLLKSNGLGPYVSPGIKSLNQGINIVLDLKLDFKSVDDFDSVKKLREVELLFSKNDVLKNFKFSDYKSQIDPACLIYADIEIQLDKLLKKANDLFYRGYSDAGNAVHELVFGLHDLNRDYFQKKEIQPEEYMFMALNIIDGARPILEQHRGYKKLLGNLVFILTLGIPFLVNKAINGHFLFFQKTNSSEQIDELNQTISQLSL